MNKKTETLDQTSNDFKALVELLYQFSEAENKLGDLESKANAEYMALIGIVKDEYAKYQEILTKTESALETIALTHPEWFRVKRSIKTPYGVVSLKTSTALEISNPEATLARVELEAAKNPEFKLDTYVRTRSELDIEALEKLDDASLKRLGIKRVTKENFKAAAAKLDLGKAVKEAVEKDQEAA